MSRQIFQVPKSSDFWASDLSWAMGPTLCPPQLEALGCFISCTPEFATKALEMEKNLGQAGVFMTFFYDGKFKNYFTPRNKS